MYTDQGLILKGNGCLAIRNINAYAFGLGDFSIAVLIQPAKQGIVLSKVTPIGDVGWWMSVEPSGAVSFTTVNGSTNYRISTTDTLSVLDGSWHSVAVIRHGGSTIVLIDGKQVPVRGSGNANGPVDINSTARLIVGGKDAVGTPTFDYSGLTEDVIMFSRAISQSEVIRTMFNLVAGDAAGLVGLWRMNGDGDDSSPNNNGGVILGTTEFVPVFHCVWTEAVNAFSFCNISSQYGNPTPGRPMLHKKPAVGASARMVQRRQLLNVRQGAPYLAATIFDSAGGYDFPSDASLSIIKPDGTTYNHESNTENLLVKLSGSSIRALVVKDPNPGSWTAVLVVPEDSTANVLFQTVPSRDAVTTITDALTPLISQGNQRTQKRLVLDEQGTSIGWYAVGKLGLGVVGLIAIIATAPTAAPAIAIVTLLSLITGAGIIESQKFLDDLKITLPTPPIAMQQAADFVGQQVGIAPKPLAEVLAAIHKKVYPGGKPPSTIDPKDFVSRQDMGVDDDYFIHLDPGGEGYHEVFGVYSGFIKAININAQTKDSQPPYGDIPLLVQVPLWDTDPPYPFVDNIADYVTMQGAKLTEKGASEIARTVREGGRVGLWIDEARFKENVIELARLIDSKITHSNQPDSGCIDEFEGKAGYPKICMTKKPRAKNGSIKVTNKAGYVASFTVTYEQGNQQKSEDSGKFTLGMSKAITVLSDALNITLKIEEAYAIDAWSTVCVHVYAMPITVCFELAGTTLEPTIKQVDCGHE